MEVSAPELCDRFTAAPFGGLTVGPSPTRIVRRLTLAGMRPISNVVDASNYVMLELGQPTHAYDLSRLRGPALLVRAAHPGERLVTLDGVDRVLGQGSHADCMICDGDDVAIGIAGIMGGASSEVHDGTTAVALEAAHFVPMAIARTSKRIGLRSEASARFERGVDIEGIDRSVARFAEILRATCPGLAPSGGTVDWRAPGAGAASPIRVRTARVNAVLGVELDAADIARLLTPIGFAVSAPDADGALAVTPPSFRPDAVDEIDVVEEVARHHGYERIARRSLRPVQVGKLTPYQRTRRFAREVLAGAGLSESAGSPLVGPGDHGRAGLEESTVVASDPLAREESVLRTSLLPGLLKAVAFNQGRRLPDLGLFEIGHAWSADPAPDEPPITGADIAPGHGLPDERELLAAVLAGRGPGEQGADGPAAVRLLDRLKTALHIEDMSLVAGRAAGLHPTRTAEVFVRSQGIGWVGEVDPAITGSWGIEGRVGYLELHLPAFAAGRRASEQARPVSRFPSSDLDLAFIVDEGEPAGAVRATLERAGGGLLERVTLFDVYRGPGVPAGSRNLAFRLRFVAHDRTLTEAELGVLRDECIQAVQSAHPATLRAGASGAGRGGAPWRRRGARAAWLPQSAGRRSCE